MSWSCILRTKDEILDNSINIGDDSEMEKDVKCVVNVADVCSLGKDLEL